MADKINEFPEEAVSLVPGETAMSMEEHMDRASDARKNPVDMTVDSDEERIKSLPYDPDIHERTKKVHAQLDAADWDDLRSLPAPPPSTFRGQGVTCYVSIGNPNLILFDPDGETVLGQFQNGYFVTDDPKVKKIIEDGSHKYIKRLDPTNV